MYGLFTDLGVVPGGQWGGSPDWQSQTSRVWACEASGGVSSVLVPPFVASPSGASEASASASGTSRVFGSHEGREMDQREMLLVRVQKPFGECVCDCVIYCVCVSVCLFV